ncbi:consortin-like [Sardina pilchardus]|uniref:consortin-like n=1 Tax=Sardina pilchardus TaxID=27697 RepID=UPI002E142D6C
MPIVNKAVVKAKEAKEIRAGLTHRGPGNPNIHHEPTVTVTKKCDKIDAQVLSEDSRLPLRLLCLVVLVISVGGMALYCMVGDPQSAVCTAFFNNIKVYMAQVLNLFSS